MAQHLLSEGTAIAKINACVCCRMYAGAFCITAAGCGGTMCECHGIIPYISSALVCSLKLPPVEDALQVYMQLCRHAGRQLV